MFTGLIEHMGRVRGAAASSAGVRLAIDPQGWGHAPKTGDSICVSGVCLTVAQEPQRAGADLVFDVVPQTLGLTTLGSLRAGEAVNLEHAATLGTLLGGHLVQGHVDGVGEVVHVRREGERRVRVGVSAELMDYLAPQGSVCVEGVSLTVAGMSEALNSTTGECWFEVALIPTTLGKTTLGSLRAGQRVNVECDAIAKQVVAWCRRSAAKGTA